MSEECMGMIRERSGYLNGEREGTINVKREEEKERRENGLEGDTREREKTATK